MENLKTEYCLGLKKYNVVDLRSEKLKLEDFANISNKIFLCTEKIKERPRLSQSSVKVEDYA